MKVPLDQEIEPEMPGPPGPAPCPLCRSCKPKGRQFDSNPDLSRVKTPFPKEFSFFHCTECDLIFRDPRTRLTPAAERDRYRHHENSAEDRGYMQFLRPVIEQVQNLATMGASGLDYGSGPTPVLADHLRSLGYQMSLYDPFFAPADEALHRTYDFVVCTEVAEHFADPGAEFERLRRLVCGPLILMTRLHSGPAFFKDWFYALDPTHVSFYSKQTMAWIAKHHRFELTTDGVSLAILTSSPDNRSPAPVRS